MFIVCVLDSDWLENACRPLLCVNYYLNIRWLSSDPTNLHLRPETSMLVTCSDFARLVYDATTQTSAADRVRYTAIYQKSMHVSV